MRRIAIPAAVMLSLVSCGWDAGEAPTPSVPVQASQSITTEASVTETGVPSVPAITLPAGIPETYDGDVAARDLPVAELVPAGDDVTQVARAHTSVDEAVVITFTTPGPDPFTQARGLVVWLRSKGADPPWRAVFGIAHRRGDGVLAISVDTTDLTGDGSADALVREETGGSGACATYRVIDLAEARPLWTRSLCDAEVQPSPDPLGLYVVARVYGPGDAHCCPSAISESVLAWREDAFVEVSESTTRI